MGRSCEVGKGSSPPASPQVVFPVWFSAVLSGSHPLPQGMSPKEVTGRSLPTQQGNVVFLHLSCIFPLLLLLWLWGCRAQPQESCKSIADVSWPNSGRFFSTSPLNNKQVSK